MTSSCLLCGFPQTDLYFTNKKNAYHKDFRICGACGYIFAFPRIPEHDYLSYYGGDYAKEIYSLKNDEVSIQEAIDWRTKSSKMKIGFFAEFYPKGVKVFEVGSGLGTFLHEMEMQYAAIVSGVELSPHFVTIAKEKFGISTYLGDAFEFFKHDKDNTYGVIIMDQVLEHLYHPLTLLNELKKKLEPNGLLYIGVPNVSSPAQDKPGFFFPEHVSHFTPYTLELLTKQAGFRIVKSLAQNFGSMHFLLTHAEAPGVAGEVKQTHSPLKRGDIDAAFEARELSNK